MEFEIYDVIRNAVYDITGISFQEMLNSNKEEAVDARYMFIYLLSTRFTDKEISIMTGISKSLANKIRDTTYIKNKKYSFKCKMKELEVKLKDYE